MTSEPGPASAPPNAGHLDMLVVTSGLQRGGAEHMLLQLLRGAAAGGLNVRVLSLTSGGPLAAEMRTLGMPVTELALGHPRGWWPALRAVITAMRDPRPALVQGWMYHGNLLATLLAAAARAPLAWSIRQSLDGIDAEKRATRVLIAASSRLSRRADLIIYNAELSRSQHRARGYRPPADCVIGNGVDTTRFRPLPASERLAIRHTLGITGAAPLIGLIGRNHPVKGHAVFLTACRHLLCRGVAAEFLIAGDGADWDQPPYTTFAHDPQLRQHVHPLGPRADVERLTAALDIANCTSWGEAFPNVLIEALSCGVPVVSTDTGDCRVILGTAGTLVARGDATALADAWTQLLTTPCQRPNPAALRARVEQQYSIAAVTQRYVERWLALGSRQSGHGAAPPAAHQRHPGRR